jgi:hypothetical protein
VVVVRTPRSRPSACAFSQPLEVPLPVLLEQVVVDGIGRRLLGGRRVVVEEGEHGGFVLNKLAERGDDERVGVVLSDVAVMNECRVVNKQKVCSDIWLDEVPLKISYHKLFQVCSEPDATVAELEEEGIWFINFIGGT